MIDQNVCVSEFDPISENRSILEKLMKCRISSARMKEDGRNYVKDGLNGFGEYGETQP